LKKELIRDQAYITRAAARAEIFEYIEVFYNRRQAHSLLGYTTPAAFDSCTGVAAAA
jgi:putative transposase